MGLKICLEIISANKYITWDLCLLRHNQETIKTWPIHFSKSKQKSTYFTIIILTSFFYSNNLSNKSQTMNRPAGGMMIGGLTTKSGAGGVNNNIDSLSFNNSLAI